MSKLEPLLPERGHRSDDDQRDGSEQRDSDAGVIREFRRIYGATGAVASADRTMLALWFTVLTGRPAAALVAYRRLVDDYLPWVERRLVHRARRSGSSWAGLGRLLDRSRQAVQQRHDRVWTVADLAPPPAPPSLDENERREVVEAGADRRRRLAADAADSEGALVAW